MQFILYKIIAQYKVNVKPGGSLALKVVHIATMIFIDCFH